MTISLRGRTSHLHSAAIALVVSSAVLAPTSAFADPLGAGGGTIYVLSPKADYQEGCFPPCLCPIMIQQPIVGTFKLTYVGLSNTGHNYAVEDVNWSVPFFDPELRITGAGKYTIASPSPITLLQQRMELDLQVGANATEHLDSGWVPIGDMTRINIVVSIHGMWCYDRVITIDADRAAGGALTPYTLESGATYQEGCWDPCDCILYDERPMVGDFALMPLSDNGLFRDFGVLNIRWQVLSPSSNATVLIRGFGKYRVGGEVAVQHQLSLELWIGPNGPTHFDSGWIGGGGQFPDIDIFVSMNGMVCWDRVLHVVAKPAVGNVICGGIGGLPCPDGFFCKLPDGACCCDYMGVCAPIPDACPEIWDPVCGCDGVTYGNECEADAAGATIAHRGECAPGCGGMGGVAPCPPGEFCKFPIGDCGSMLNEGVCSPIPQACITLWDPVCGCDGMTYGNECEADRAGVSVDHRGECGQRCGGFAGLPCPDGFFCKLPDGQCCCDFFGTCTRLPSGCPDVWDPVCGCDGMTYSNECDANAAGVSVNHRGPCTGPPPCAASRDLSDPDFSYCPGDAKKVLIVLAPPNSTATVLGVEDSPPSGWMVSNISHGGAYDPVNGKVKWGPLFAPFPPALSYQVMPVPTNSMIRCFYGTVSINGVNQPICGDECVHEHCCMNMPADVPQAVCGDCPVGDCGSCGDGTCEDERVSLCEVIGYACSWMRGCNDDLSGMTRAAFIWRSGECYCWDDGPQTWSPTLCPAPESGCCPASTPGPDDGSTATVEVAVTTMEAPSTISVVRDRSVYAWTVPVTIEPPSGTSAVALEVQVPAGWVVASISDGGSWDDVHRKIKWGPFFDDVTRIVTFQVRPAIEPIGGKARSLRGGLRLTGLSGTVSFDGVNQPISVR